MEQPPPYSQGNQYPPQSAPYPPEQHPGYPPQKDHGGSGYPPQGYPPQGQGYPPQGQGYPPQGQGYPPQGHFQQPAGFSSQTNNTTTVVVQNQPQVVTSTVIPVVNDQMGLAIFACLCCCPLIGLIAIVKSSESRSRYVSGDYVGAVSSAQSSRNLSYAAIVCGLIMIPLIIVLRVVVFATTYESNDYNN
ncbi:uncharacterized protein LOC114525485 [Dendronephthya gigantea]|uniref:uncharacterized protein LOC114525485 n=1 Tax=Dendronephthya gigantea TaxID=151771 RepID=UPI00106B6FCB|nr:uncharacterized protein LOC114525485 [Dendronephthya gigantea]XP_028402659.1 uncharacterized protein LOC114525485 [Dendronephthya gigantea]